MLDCQCRHEFSHSNAWTALTDVPPKELRWPLCTGWTLGWCRMLPMPVSVQRYECCPVVVGWCLMLCHTQCNHSQTWSDHSDEVESLLALCLQHTDVLLKWEVRHSPRNFVDSSTGRSVFPILTMDRVIELSINVAYDLRLRATLWMNGQKCSFFYNSITPII